MRLLSLTHTSVDMPSDIRRELGTYAHCVLECKMKPSEALHRHKGAVLRIARTGGASNVRIFGSVLDGSDEDGSDLDLLVDVPRGTTLLDMARLQAALEAELGISVDVLTAGDLPPSFRNRVLEQASPL